jgi:hypothetical protein
MADIDTPTPIPPISPGVKELLPFAASEAKQTPEQLQIRCRKVRPLVSVCGHKTFGGAVTFGH